MSNIELNKATEEQKIVASRFFKNQEYFSSKLYETYVNDGVFTFENALALNEFIEFLKTKVTIIQIRAHRFDTAYQIFEILNNRGLPLSNKDLFRNFLISKFTTLAEKRKDIDPAQKWYDLEYNYELDSEFISRYVESKRGKSQRYSAFNDLQDIYNDGFEMSLSNSKIESFYEEIVKYLNIYSMLKNGSHPSREIRNRVKLRYYHEFSG